MWLRMVRLLKIKLEGSRTMGGCLEGADNEVREGREGAAKRFTSGMVLRLICNGK